MDFKTELAKLGYNKGNSIDVEILINEILPELFFKKINFEQASKEKVDFYQQGFADGVESKQQITKCRYVLFERKDLNSRVLLMGSNKSEMKKNRTGWKYQMHYPHITADIYDYFKQEWVK
jgi:hypothetical protein